MHPVQVSSLLAALGFVMAIVAVILSCNLSRYAKWSGAALFVSLASFMGAFGSILLAVWRAFG